MTSADSLLRHTRFLRTLALALVRDEATADDAVQDVLTIALGRSPPAGASLRGWLAGVLRNVVRRSWRSHARRARRERIVATVETSADAMTADAVVAQKEVLERLVAVVFALREPYRSAILQRYFEDLSPPAIAAREGVPLETVRTRLKRALDELRRALEARHRGDRRVWCAALAGLTGVKTTATVVSGVAVMTVWTKIALVSAAALVLAIPLAVDWHPTPPIAPAPLVRNDEPAGAVASSAAPERVVAEAAVHPIANAPSTSVWLMHGTVRDEQGALIADAHVTLRGEDDWKDGVLANVECAADGTYAVDLETMLATISPYIRRASRLFGDASAPGYGKQTNVLLEDLWVRPVPKLASFFLRRLRPMVSGSVRDLDGRPVVGAQVALQAVAASEIPWRGETGLDGRYRIEIPASGSYLLHALAFDRGLGSIGPLAIDGERDFAAPDILVTGPGVIAGVATYPDGKPARELHLFARPSSVPMFAERKLPASMAGLTGLDRGETLTDANGRFRFAGLAPGRFVLDQQNTNATIVSRPREFDTGSTDVHLVVVNHRLHVRVVDEVGVLQPHVSLVVNHGVGHTSALDSGTGELWLQVWFDTQRDEPTATVRLSASATGMLPGEQVVTMSRAEYEREVELVLRHLDDEPGSLAITVHDEDGRAIERFTATLRTLASTGLVPGFSHAIPDSRGVLVGAPPGRWQLRVLPGELLHRAWEELTMFFPIETEVDVQPAEETRVALVARAGSRVRFTVRAAGVDHGTPLPERVITARRNGGVPERMRTFWTLHRDGSAESGSFFDDEAAASNDLLEPGDYLFRIVFDGFAPIERSATLLPGKIIDVDVPLERP